MKTTVKVLIVFLIVVLAGLTGLIYFVQSENNREVADLNQRIDNQQVEINRQSSEKKAIRDIWEDQAFENEQLLGAQQNLISQLYDYLSTLDLTITTGADIEVLETANGIKLQNIREQLELEISNLEEKTESTTKAAEENQEKINQAYSQEQGE